MGAVSMGDQVYGPPAVGKSASLALTAGDQLLATIPAGVMAVLTAAGGDLFWGLANATNAANRALLLSGGTVAFQAPMGGPCQIHVVQGPTAGGTVYLYLIG